MKQQHLLEVLQGCIVENNIVRLPPEQLDRNLYLEVKRKLELIGGKWKGGKEQGFVFSDDPSELLTQIANGEERNLKKELQFFATPARLADKMVLLADLKEQESVLEPSAGQGAIIEAILRIGPKVTIQCYEISAINRKFLEKLECSIEGEDFFEAADTFKYDKIIANPPFSGNQDISHIYAMWDRLEKGGRLVALTSPHWTFAKDRKCERFREWVKEEGAYIEEVPKGTFKESGTLSRSFLIRVDKGI